MGCRPNMLLKDNCLLGPFRLPQAEDVGVDLPFYLLRLVQDVLRHLLFGEEKRLILREIRLFHPYTAHTCIQVVFRRNRGICIKGSLILAHLIPDASPTSTEAGQGIKPGGEHHG